MLRLGPYFLRPVCHTVWLLSWTKVLVGFATITLPRFIYGVLSYSMTLTVRSTVLSSPPSYLKRTLARILELCNTLRLLCNRPELLDPLQIPQRLHAIERTAACETGRE